MTRTVITVIVLQAAIILAFLALGLYAPPPADAHYSEREAVADGIVNTNYDGICGRGISRCVYVGRPWISKYRFKGNHGRYFAGYYQEIRLATWHGLPALRVYECKPNGQVRHVPNKKHPYNNGILLDRNPCHKVK